MQEKQSQSISWNSDIHNNLIIQRKLLIILNFLLATGLIIALIWMKIIIGQDKVEPFVIEIDKKTGMATSVDPVTIQEYSANTAVLRSLVIQYIKAREEYIYAIYEKNFQLMKILSDPAIFRSYAVLFGSGNPNSPYSIYGQNATISVKWKSIIFPQKDTAQVRITVAIKDSAGSIKQVEKIVLMSFEFKPDQDISEGDRLLNPLGFYVKMYKIEDENPNI